MKSETQSGFGRTAVKFRSTKSSGRFDRAAAGWWWTVPALVFLYLVVTTWRSEWTRAGTAMVVLMLAGYYVVYVTTPHPQFSYENDIVSLAVAASDLPAGRAARVDPLLALRHD